MGRIKGLISALPFLALAPLASCGKGENPRQYAHIFVIVEENRGFDQIIGNPSAPNINRLAETYGLATRFYGEVHPSEANYVAMLAGSTFGIHDDDAWYCSPGKQDPYCYKSQRPDYVDHTIRSKSLVDQLDKADLTWKGYFESIPAAGSKAVFSSASNPNEPDRLYAAKHNAFLNFASVQDDSRLDMKLVGFDRLAKDLASGDLPNYAHIIPNQCNEMHGMDGNDPTVPPDCVYSNDQGLIARGDKEIGELVREIQASPAWSAKANFAVVITWDEDDGPHPSRDAGKTQGCCGYDPKSPANFGGGHIATIVITNHGPRGVKDDTPYNHYSLLRTTEEAFGISEHLNEAGDDAAGVVPMSKLFWN
ncbi:MAG TPA: alkaline phosphatase family protein [Alphaproteobacteria bacterium]|nr:alkaline phosphatase family protein [Alphaproteobacteria bacterium]